ncbi:restriction endonuclease subunit S [Thiothrix lacustris]|uniref:Restriction endonuclease subunit S n=1 Tax=Thiothrix lacustris TaxID=525917 RepID=A0ABY9MQS7_9GAMM|nr:restriction endonuclease subunit S [Thiothrix lacustris]WML90576.1 restriction endonuclease subunit S [Thiothrix lacustris]
MLKAGWKRDKFANLLQKVGTIDPAKQPKMIFKYVDVSSVSRETLEIDNVQEILGKDAPSRARRYIKKGDILFATIRPTLKRIAIVPDYLDGQVCSTGYFVFRATSEIYNGYIFYYLLSKSFSDAMESLQKGASYPAVNDNDVKDQFVIYPSLPEQKRIVAILDEAFANISQAVANAEKNLVNARELFDSYLNEVFTRKGDGWEDFALNSVCVVERGSSPRPIDAYTTTEIDGVNWIKIGDTKGVGKYIERTKEKITPAGALKSRRVDPGDFILTNSMSYGKPYIMATTGYIHDGWFALRLNDGVDTEFFYYLLSSQVVQNQFSQLAAGAIVKNISGDLVKKTILPIPPKQKQIEIAQCADSLLEKVQELEGVYRRKLAALAELKQTLLQKAFTGELTAANHLHPQ